MKFAMVVTLFLLSLPVMSHALTIDMRVQTVPNEGSYEIAFCSRPSPDTIKSLPGHAFVSFSASQPGGQRDFISVGHTIKSGSDAAAIWSLFGPTAPGYIDEERYTSALENCLRVVVNKSTFDTIKPIVTDPLADMGLSTGLPIAQGYRLNSEDCVSFAISVAERLEHLGLVVPPRGAVEFPAPYIQRLIAANEAHAM